MTVEMKRYLDYAGLKAYDGKIKELIKAVDSKVGDVSSLTSDTIQNLAQALAYEIERAKNADADFEARIGDEDTVGTILGRLHTLEAGESGMTPEKVNELINAALALLVDGAPETFDTLKEIADWIEKDEAGTAQLVADVAQNKDDLAELRPYVDAQDTSYYNSISSIDTAELDMLFKDEVAVDDVSTLQATLDALGENEVAVLPRASKVQAAVNVPSGASLDACESTLAGALTTGNDSSVTRAVVTGDAVVHGLVMDTEFKGKVTVDGDAEFVNCAFTGGTKPKQSGVYGVSVTDSASASFRSCSFANKGYAAVYVATTGSVSVSECEFDCTGVYNPFECQAGANGAAITSVKISDCVMRGVCGNNYVNLYHFADGAVVDIDRLKVVGMSKQAEVVRISNLTSNDATVNVRDLSYSYDMSTVFDEKWTAAFLAQDHSKDGSQDMSKIKLNVSGMTVNGKKVTDKENLPLGKFIAACDVNLDETENKPTITFIA